MEAGTKVFEDLVWRDAGRMSGESCIYGTRVRVSDLFNWIAQGGTIQDFLHTYPHIPKDRALRILQLAMRDIEAHLDAA